MDLVFANCNTTVIRPSGASVPIRAGEHWPASDPVVKDHPKLFTDDPTIGLRVSAPLSDGEEDGDAEAPVEQATKAPGEKRQTRRRA